MDKDLIKHLLNRKPESHKYDFGHVLVIGGSPGMVGAPFLTARAALRIGAGLVTIASTREVVEKLERRVQEIMTFDYTDQPHALKRFIVDRKISVIAIGPGMKPEHAINVLRELKEIDLPIVADGGALTALAEDHSLIRKDMVLTPHLGEFQRFFTKPLPKETKSLQELSADFASSHNVTLVLKGHPTHVFGPHGEPYENGTGGPELSTAGTGDVLTGMIAGIMAQKFEPFSAAKAAVYIHGLAGSMESEAKTQPGVIASDVIEAIPKALKVVQKREV